MIAVLSCRGRQKSALSNLERLGPYSLRAFTGRYDLFGQPIYTEGELDDSQLTLKDLTLLSDTFQRILTGIFHQRIEYPSAKSPEKNGKTREETACAVDPKAAEHAA